MVKNDKNLKQTLDQISDIKSVIDKVNSTKNEFTKKIGSAKKIGTIAGIVIITTAVLKKFIGIMSSSKSKQIEKSEEYVKEAKRLQSELDKLPDMVKHELITENEAIKEYNKIEKKIISLLNKTNDRYLEYVIEFVNGGEKSMNEKFNYLLEKVLSITPPLLEDLYMEDVVDTVASKLKQATQQSSQQRKPAVSATEVMKSISKMKSQIDELQKNVYEGKAGEREIIKMKKEIMSMKDSSISSDDFNKFRQNAVHKINVLHTKQKSIINSIDELKTKMDGSISSCNKKITAGNVLSAAAIVISTIALVSTFCSKFKNGKNKKIEKLNKELGFLENQVKSVMEQVKNGTMKQDTGALKIKSLNAKMEKISNNLSKLISDTSVKESVVYDIDYINFLMEKEDILSQRELDNTFIEVCIESQRNGYIEENYDYMQESVNNNIIKTCEDIVTKVIESTDNDVLKALYESANSNIISRDEFEYLLYMI